jgi:hypothetical protein
MPSTSETWYFEVVVCLQHDQTFSDLLNARKQTLGSCFDVASEILWAHSQVESEILGLTHEEGFAHVGSSSRIHLESWHTSMAIIMATFGIPGYGDGCRDLYRMALLGCGADVVAPGSLGHSKEGACH